MRAIGMIFIGLLLGAFYVWAALLLYNWFLLAEVHVVLRFWQMYGIGLFLDVMLVGYLPMSGKASSNEDILTAAGVRLIYASATLGLGYAIHSAGLA